MAVDQSMTRLNHHITCLIMLIVYDFKVTLTLIEICASLVGIQRLVERPDTLLPLLVAILIIRLIVQPFIREISVICL